MIRTEKHSAQSGIALYAKIASVLRTQIASGDLPLGHRLPSIEQLSAAYGVAPITVRQAVRLLVDEGLLSSQRGRGTFVTGGNRVSMGTGTNLGLQSANSDITVLEDDAARALPDEFRFDHVVEPSYRWIRKLHHDGERAYFFLDAFIAPELESHLPAKLERLMIINALADEFLARRVEVFSTVNVSSADLDTSNLLKCSLSFPVAQISRRYVDADKRLLLATKAVYRADVFSMQMHQSAIEFLASRTPSSVDTESASPQGELRSLSG